LRPKSVAEGEKRSIVFLWREMELQTTGARRSWLWRKPVPRTTNQGVVISGRGQYGNEGTNVFNGEVHEDPTGGAKAEMYQAGG